MTRYVKLSYKATHEYTHLFSSSSSFLKALPTDSSLSVSCQDVFISLSSSLGLLEKGKTEISI